MSARTIFIRARVGKRLKKAGYAKKRELGVILEVTDQRGIFKRDILLEPRRGVAFSHTFAQITV